MNINFQNMCQICILVFSKHVVGSLVFVQRVQSIESIVSDMTIPAGYSSAFLPVSTLYDETF